MKRLSHCPHRIICSFIDEVVSVHSSSSHVNHLVIPVLEEKINPSAAIAALLEESLGHHVTLALPASFEILHFILTITKNKLSEWRRGRWCCVEVGQMVLCGGGAGGAEWRGRGQC